MRKKFDAWALKTPTGEILPRYTHHDPKHVRADAVDNFAYPHHYSWALLYREGYRVVKVKLKEVK
jgi:hypothetical protein